MEINYNGVIYFIENINSLNNKELSDSSWFLVKNYNEPDIEQLMEIRQAIKYEANVFNDNKIKERIKELEKNIFH